MPLLEDASRIHATPPILVLLTHASPLRLFALRIPLDLLLEPAKTAPQQSLALLDTLALLSMVMLLPTLCVRLNNAPAELGAFPTRLAQLDYNAMEPRAQMPLDALLEFATVWYALLAPQLELPCALQDSIAI